MKWNGKGPRPNRSGQRRGPLRKIVRVLVASSGNMFDSPLVELECGHAEYSNGAHRARCSKCRRDQEATPTESAP